MVDGKRIQEFWSHWEHEPNTTEEFKRFRIRMTEVSRKLWDDFFKGDGQKSRRERFAIVSGTAYSFNEYFQQSGLCSLLTQAESVFEVANAVQYYLWTAEEVLTHGNFDYFCRQLQEAFDLSPSILIRLVRHGTKATLYPTGVRLLDEALVEDNLIWLSRYPAVSKHFETALKLYASKDPSQTRNMLDSLRFALEQMLQVTLNNGRALENQKDEFLGWLKQHGVHAQIRNMYQTLLSYFMSYQNDAVKHGEDEYTEVEVEFVLYAAGTFLRLILRLQEQEAAKST
jgi:hypothetical protein